MTMNGGVQSALRVRDERACDIWLERGPGTDMRETFPDGESDSQLAVVFAGHGPLCDVEWIASAEKGVVIKKTHPVVRGS